MSIVQIQQVVTTVSAKQQQPTGVRAMLANNAVDSGLFQWRYTAQVLVHADLYAGWMPAFVRNQSGGIERTTTADLAETTAACDDAPSGGYFRIGQWLVVHY